MKVWPHKHSWRENRAWEAQRNTNVYSRNHKVTFLLIWSRQLDPLYLLLHYARKTVKINLPSKHALFSLSGIITQPIVSRCVDLFANVDLFFIVLHVFRLHVSNEICSPFSFYLNNLPCREETLYFNDNEATPYLYKGQRTLSFQQRIQLLLLDVDSSKICHIRPKNVMTLGLMLTVALFDICIRFGRTIILHGNRPYADSISINLFSSNKQTNS